MPGTRLGDWRARCLLQRRAGVGSDPRRSALCRFGRENGRPGNSAKRVKIDTFFAELKRRNVYKVAVAYAVAGWLVIQVSSTVLPTFHAPEWVVQTLVVLVALGFPIALVIAWAFEITPEGIKRTEVADAAHEHSRGKTWIY